jgi:multiple sugar transport system permease protein
VILGSDASHPASRRWGASRAARRWPWLRSRSLKGIGYVTPTAVVVGVFFIVPLFLVFWMSVNRWPLLGSPEVNFPDNFNDIRDNQLFKDSVMFTLKYTAIVTVVLSAFAMALALMVQRPRRGVGLMRTAFFLPGAVGFAAAALLFYGFYSETGPLNDILHSVGIINEPVAWLGTPDRALFSTIVMVIWRFAGFNMLILLTGLAAIPTDVYEAARVDGARSWQTFRHITLPLLRPTIALMLVLSITGSLLAFDQFFILTRGGPDGSTVSMVMVIYREAFTQFDLGGAAALSVLLLIALVLLNVIQLRVLGSRDDR